MGDREHISRRFLAGAVLIAAACGGSGSEATPGAQTGAASTTGAGGSLPGLLEPYKPPMAGTVGVGSAGTTSAASGPTRPWWTAGNGAAGGFTPPPQTPGTGTTVTPPAPAATAGTTSPTPATGGTAAPATGGTSAASAAGSGATGSNLAGIPDAELDMLRQTCVDEINMYRATLTSLMLKPFRRATPEQEACSDKGAMQDGDSMVAHGAARAGLCYSVGLTAENTCPGWGVGGFSGNATLADALKGCLKAMWAEGEPPVSRAMCMQDVSGCFQAHGHYLNMSGSGAGAVACSFYKMKDGKYWMNQDFSQR